ncbi:MAG: hypothetical protein KIT09_16255 [Bryobacteraceae bacterium]|nr:hypothetical protein [Bryobacteraceae bacterium]
MRRFLPLLLAGRLGDSTSDDNRRTKLGSISIGQEIKRIWEGSMLKSHRFLVGALLIWPALHSAIAQAPTPFPRAQRAKERAEHLADLYNWYDAHPYFSEAEKMFIEEGDERNALLAGASRLRGEMQILPRWIADRGPWCSDDLRGHLHGQQNESHGHVRRQ